MKRKTTDELAEILFNETMVATKIYFETKKVKSIDRGVWAWMHIGFISALLTQGYQQKECDEIIEKTQALLNEVE